MIKTIIQIVWLIEEEANIILIFLFKIIKIGLHIKFKITMIIIKNEILNKFNIKMGIIFIILKNIKIEFNIILDAKLKNQLWKGIIPNLKNINSWVMIIMFKLK